VKSRNDGGFGLLLELLIAMAITTVLLAGSTVLAYRVRAAQNQTDAQTRLRQVAQAEAAIAICAQTAGCTPSVGLTAIIPPDGSAIEQSGYTFTFQLEWWILDVHRCSDSSRVLWNGDVLHGLYRRLQLFAGQYSVGRPSEPNLLKWPGIDRWLGGFHYGSRNHRFDDRACGFVSCVLAIADRRYAVFDVGSL